MNEPTGFVPGTFADGLPQQATNYSPSHIGTDPLRWLAPAAADRLRLLQRHSNDLHLLLPPFEDRKAASDAKLAAERRLKELQDHPQQGGFGLGDGHRSVLEAKQEVKRLSADWKRLNDLYTERAAAWQAASSVHGAVENWLKFGRPGGTQLETVEVEAPKLLKGETVLDAVERLRRRVRELRADAHRIRSAPYPSAYCKAQMRQQVEALAERGSPSVTQLVEHDGKVEFSTQHLRARVLAEQPALAFAEQIDSLKLFCWTFRDALVAKLDREIDAEADDKNFLSVEARQQAEAEVQGDLLAVEREECWFVWAAQAQGLQIEHRPDVSVAALLSITLVTAPRGAALPVSSPELAINFVGPR